MKKFASIAALAVIPALSIALGTSVFADSPGQLAGGSNLYKVRNVTQNGAYSSTISAACNETVKYSVEVSNTQFGALSNVMVKGNLASGALNVSATNTDGQTVTSNGNVQVNVANGGSLQYVAGSTQLYTINGQLVKTLADGVTAGGVNAGDLGGSTREFVQFQAKVNCPTTPPQTPETPKTPEAPVELPHTGATGVFAFVASLVTLVAAYVVTARKNVLG